MCVCVLHFSFWFRFLFAHNYGEITVDATLSMYLFEEKKQIIDFSGSYMCKKSFSNRPLMLAPRVYWTTPNILHLSVVHFSFHFERNIGKGVLMAIELHTFYQHFRFTHLNDRRKSEQKKTKLVVVQRDKPDVK